jgi:hypothetical protein
VGPPDGLFAELSRWRDKAVKRGKVTHFNSDIIPDWLNVELVAAQEVVGPDAFSFLKRTPLEVRMAAERRIKRKLQAVLEKYKRRAATAVRRGEQFDYAGMADEMRAAVTPELSSLVLDNVMRLSVDTGISFDPAVINTEALRWARQFSHDWANKLNETTRRQLSEVLSAFVETPGMTIGDIETLIEPAFGAVRAEMIAVTETTRAYAMATNELQGLLAQETPELTTVQVWNTMNDEFVCRVCGPAEGAPKSEWPGLGLPNDGPPAHPNCRCGTSIRFETLEQLGAEFGERQAAREAWMRERGLWKEPPRPLSARETDLLQEIGSMRPIMEAIIAEGDPTGAGLKSVIDTLEQQLDQERKLNQELWDMFKVGPNQATDLEWRQLADKLKAEGMELYNKYTREGIQSTVAHMRGAKQSGWMVVGKEQIQVRQGAFSASAARRIEGEMWQQAKGEMSGAMGQFLQRAGYSAQDISQASFEQRRRLLEELGQKQLIQTGSGRVSVIDKVPVDARGQVVELADYDLAAIAENSAIDPLSLPTLDAYSKLELSDLIRATRIGEEF